MNHSVAKELEYFYVLDATVYVLFPCTLIAARIFEVTKTHVVTLRCNYFNETCSDEVVLSMHKSKKNPRVSFKHYLVYCRCRNIF